jgi:hypothetical protein
MALDVQSLALLETLSVGEPVHTWTREQACRPAPQRRAHAGPRVLRPFPCRDLAAEGGYVVVSVEYRLAPMRPSLAAIEDAAQWVARHMVSHTLTDGFAR